MERGTDSRGKRKLQEEEGDGYGALSLDELNQDLLERVLSRLPTSTFLSLTSVCKRWKSISDSPTFKLACSEVPARDPWFLMVGPLPRPGKCIVFDSVGRNWKQLGRSPLLLSKLDSIPVASSGGLVCFRGARDGDLAVCNPLTGSAREIPRSDLPSDARTLHAIVMRSRPLRDHSFDIIVVHGEFPKLFFKGFDSKLGTWGPDIALTRISSVLNSDSLEAESTSESVYFLSKAGDVVATDMLRSPSKQYSSVMIVEDGGEILYFLSSSGTVVGCDLARGSFSEYPRLLPFCLEYSIDVMECRGEMVVAVLSEFLDTASLRIWRFDEECRSWAQMAAMPPSMSHEFYGKKMDINCVGLNDRVLICLNSGEVFRYILYDVAANEWVELPQYRVNGVGLEFSSAFSFEPRIEASV
ncbi:F-box only protein 13 [Punica granatum]|uniref:F-box only protein 13 n=1 Tax=Punica granatum TaxID=22663 RepID=A0A218XE09_PUNGR|nr:F-box only protein 13 [Punica granatum]OWM83038.1 hypothetical protein CDL15_Pgr016520 [Punica granatum]